MDVQTWYLKTSKLALALAIIHSKPADRSSREYAEQLAILVTQRDSKGKSKVEALEAEVLQLRQQLFLSRISSGFFKNGHDAFPPLLDQEPRSSENTLALMDDSGCILSSEQRSELAELSQHLVESCSPPPLLPLPLEKKPCTTLGNPPSSHLQFLQHLLELKKLTESSGLKVYLSHFEKDSSTVSDSVAQLLDGLITFYRNPKLPFSSFWMEAVGTLARLMNDYNLPNHILKKCSKKLEEFEKTLLQAILANDSINRFQMQHHVSQSLVTLGRCSLLRKPIILLLLSEVNSFVDDLGAISQSSYQARQVSVKSFLTKMTTSLWRQAATKCAILMTLPYHIVKSHLIFPTQFVFCSILLMMIQGDLRTPTTFGLYVISTLSLLSIYGLLHCNLRRYSVCKSGGHRTEKDSEVSGQWQQ
ncbi:meiosis-specific protein MEI4 [Chionomys nivalis]|uniref:meiosis-specific protein MEI4 n=1 Tax=Chionomys nivalis TaxID=269649 RepID=UPI0025940775|nr:meiosis-specific protein MEI4 [Chionomys nivalis]